MRDILLQCAGLAAIAADEPNFIDHKTSYNFVGE